MSDRDKSPATSGIPPGPPALPECGYCGNDFLDPRRGYKHGCPKHDQATRAAVEEDIYHVPSSQCWEGSRGRAHGNVHLHVTEDVVLGRLKRRAGECLCEKRHGSYERELDAGEREVTFRCERCHAIAVRNGIEWPSAARVAA